MRGMVFSAVALAGIILFAGQATAAERHVPSEYSTIQAAISASSNGDVVIIAVGTYTGSGNKALDFAGRAITVRSTNPDDPCVVAATVIDCENSGGGFIFMTGEDNNSVVEGLTITHGMGFSGHNGGAILITGSSPKISKNIITGNGGFVGHEIPGNGCGGGIFIFSGSPLIIENLITNNRAYGGWFQDKYGIHYYGGIGGGIYVAAGGSPTIVNNTITANIAATMEGVVSGSGGGIYSSGSATVINCCISNNSAGTGGGISTPSYTTVKNSTITANSVSSFGYGGGFYIYLSTGDAIITDSIVWGNSPTEIYTYTGGSATINFSDVNGGWAGTGNIDADPLFADGPQGSYYLSQIAAGQASNSPCIDAGSDYAAMTGFWDSSTRTDLVPDTDLVDMGYHFGSFTLDSPGNINGDDIVNMVDFAILGSQWQQTPGNPSADIAPPNGDGIVNYNDLKVMTQSWLWMSE